MFSCEPRECLSRGMLKNTSEPKALSLSGVSERRGAWSAVVLSHVCLAYNIFLEFEGHLGWLNDVPLGDPADVAVLCLLVNCSVFR